MTPASHEPAVDRLRQTIDVSIVMPCLNEILSLEHCINNALEALAAMQSELGLIGEIVIADNGSTDGSQALAARLGARVVPVSRRGYGAALIGGCTAANGRYIVMGDCDGSYDFRESVGMVATLVDGAELCMGSRFKGGIKPGAMPWKNRYIGNPVLTGVLNILFRTGISDAHCGLRAFTRDCFDKLGLTGSGMEFASEMVIKASLLGCRIAERPATLSPDLRDRPPHLRPWRDGWRHLRYLFMLSPTWLFAIPAALMALFAVAIFGKALSVAMSGATGLSTIGNYWTIAAGAMLSVAHITAILAVASHLYGVREGYRKASRGTAFLARWVTLESMLIGGLALLALGGLTLGLVVGYWSVNRYAAISNVLPAVFGTSLLAIGMQNALGGFLLAIVAGNEAEFLKAPVADVAKPTVGVTEKQPEQPRQRAYAGGR
ncbi:MAG TPA: glycosyltransferase family 2 protein [Hyphomicrobiaceae bacterium]|nr:glycosyltransferase family 2 protein [Hyphomicrobiaceae bacterium]